MQREFKKIVKFVENNLAEDTSNEDDNQEFFAFLKEQSRRYIAIYIFSSFTYLESYSKQLLRMALKDCKICLQG